MGLNATRTAWPIRIGVTPASAKAAGPTEERPIRIDAAALCAETAGRGRPLKSTGHQAGELTAKERHVERCSLGRVCLLMAQGPTEISAPCPLSEAKMG